jgi:hypothetical protein
MGHCYASHPAGPHRAGRLVCRMPPSGPSEMPGDSGPYGDPEAANNSAQGRWLRSGALAVPVRVIPPISVQRPPCHARRVYRGLSHDVLLWPFGPEFPPSIGVTEQTMAHDQMPEIGVQFICNRAEIAVAAGAGWPDGARGPNLCLNRSRNRQGTTWKWLPQRRSISSEVLS